MSSSLEAIFVYGYFGRECLEQLSPLGVAAIAVLVLQASPFAVHLHSFS